MRVFGAYFTAHLISGVGTAVTQVMIPLIVFRYTHSPVGLGISFAVEFLPYLLFGLVTGAIVDRLSRRAVMITTDVARGLVVLTLPVLALAGALHVWMVYADGFVVSAFTIGFDAADFAAVPELVPAERLDHANGQLSAASSGAMVAGPFLGGFLLLIAQPTTALVADAASYFASAISLLLILHRLPGRPERHRADRASVRSDVMDGIRFVFGNPVLRAMAILLALSNLFVGSVVERQVVFLLKVRFDATNSDVAWVVTASGLAIVVASLAAGAVRRRASAAQAILIPMFGGGVCIILAGVLPSLAAVAAIWAVGAALGIFVVVTVRTLRQRLSPPEMLARVITANQVLTWSAIPVGAIAGGWLISEVGVGVTFVALGSLQVCITAAFLLTPLRTAERSAAATAGLAGPHEAQRSVAPDVTRR
jgi:MFS family permease